MPTLDGPRRPPRSGPAQSLVVLLHGYGADGNDLIGLADAWAEQLPATAFVAPDAPEQIGGGGFGGRQWFALTLRDPREYLRGVRSAGPALDAFIDAEMARCGLAPRQVALVGFSQGTMMALHVGMRRQTALAGIVGYSGVIAGAETLPAEIAARPPVLLVHGADDELIPVGAIHLTREALAGAGVGVEWHVCERLGHGIDEDGLRLAGSFLGEQLRKV